MNKQLQKEILKQFMRANQRPTTDDIRSELEKNNRENKERRVCETRSTVYG